MIRLAIILFTTIFAMSSRQAKSEVSDISLMTTDSTIFLSHLRKTIERGDLTQLVDIEGVIGSPMKKIASWIDRGQEVVRYVPSDSDAEKVGVDYQVCSKPLFCNEKSTPREIAVLRFTRLSELICLNKENVLTYFSDYTVKERAGVPGGFILSSKQKDKTFLLFSYQPNTGSCLTGFAIQLLNN